jgi:hypothetical protein
MRTLNNGIKPSPPLLNYLEGAEMKGKKGKKVSFPITHSWCIHEKDGKGFSSWCNKHKQYLAGQTCDNCPDYKEVK